MSLIPFGFWAASGGGAAGAYDLLETTTLTSSASSVTFTGLGSYSDYAHLQVRYVARTTYSGARGLRTTINGDTSSAYAYHLLHAYGSGVSSSGVSSANFIDAPDTLPGTSFSSGIFGFGLQDILDFGNSSKNKTMKFFAAQATNTRFYFGSGMRNNTAAITSLTYTPEGGSFIAGTRFSIYGIKGA